MRTLGNYREFVIGLSWVALFLLLFLIVGATGWMGWGPDSCVKDNSCFCEAFHKGFIKQPSNTWSNVGFILVGLSILWWIGWQRATGTRYGPPNRMTTTDDVFYPTVYGNVAAFMGPGSMMFHGSMTAVGGVIDGLSMYMWAAFFLVYSLVQITEMDRTLLGRIFLVSFLYCGIVLLATILHASIKNISPILIAVLVAPAVVIQVIRLIQGKYEWWGWVYFFAAVASFLVAFLFWQLSKTGGSWCDPTSPLQGHAVWQLLSAVMVGCIYLFFRAERG